MLQIKHLYKTKTGYLDKIFKSFHLTEKVIFITIAAVMVISSLVLFDRANSLFRSTVPAHGGSLTEGVIGSPRFINPLLELSDADRDLTYLIYSGLMRATAAGDLIPDLAESYTVSEDGLTYTFKLRDNAFFHDGHKVTTEDVAYTVEMAQDANLRSPKRTNWTGVTTNIVSPNKITFSLTQPYSPFLENTTLGIMPKHIWQGASVEEFPFIPFNTEPIGSGPYEVNNIKRNGSGVPTAYELTAYDEYALGEPYISKLQLNFYPNEKALADAYFAGQIDSTSALSAQNLDLIKDGQVNKKKFLCLESLASFFNQNQAKVFLNKEVRQALDLVVDRDRIVSEVLEGYGEKIDGPLPNGILKEKSETIAPFDRDAAIAKASDILTKTGWVKNSQTNVWEKIVKKKVTDRLAFDLSTSNTPDLKKVAEILKEDWGKLGAEVEIKTFESSDLSQSVINQRKYDALLFGEIVGRSLDLFAFWHSSQRKAGYNVALYTNSKADKLLADARQITDQAKRLEKYEAFAAEVKNDIPAIFLYSPEFIYLLPNKVQGANSGLINNRSERFEEIQKWFIETDQVWNFLIKK